MKNALTSFFVSAALVCVLLTGCAEAPAKKSWEYTAKPATDITKASYLAADALMAQIEPTFSAGTPFIAATLVNINRLDTSSPLGRLIGEQVAARFAQKSFHVLELKLRNDIYMKRNEGELMLTREVREIARRHNAKAIIAGTFTDSYDRVFVNIKVIDFETNVVVGAVDYFLERDELIRSLLVAN